MADYLITFLSIIIGYIVTQFFEGWQLMLAKASLSNIYWLHLGWTLFDFIYVIYLWWVFGFFQKRITVNFFVFFIILSPCFFLYLIAAFIFPDSSEIISSINFKDFYYQQSSMIFLWYSLLMLFSTISAPYIFKETHFWNTKTCLRALLCTIFTIAIFYKNHIYHSIIFTISCLIFSWFIKEYYSESRVLTMINGSNQNTNQQP